MAVFLQKASTYLSCSGLINSVGNICIHYTTCKSIQYFYKVLLRSFIVKLEICSFKIFHQCVNAEKRLCTLYMGIIKIVAFGHVKATSLTQWFLSLMNDFCKAQKKHVVWGQWFVSVIVCFSSHNRTIVIPQAKHVLKWHLPSGKFIQ